LYANDHIHPNSLSMKIICFLTIALLPFFSTAQNWQCLQIGQRQYYTNSHGYLRGMRVDSVRSSGGAITYYPYHTLRGPYLTTFLDSTGGSWLGKAVVQRGSTFIFDDIWNDSAIINTQANVGNTWTFYQDTTSLYYNATCIAKDTMTVLGVMDSVSKILITAHNTSGIVTADPADSFEIILSKNHGFIQVFDLYTFPYHKPDSVYTTGIDLYLDFDVPPGRSTSIFSLVNLYNPTYMQMVNWSSGDAFEYTAFNPDLICATVYPQSFMWFFDSIVAVNTYPDRVEYDCVGWRAVQDCYHSTSSYAIYDTFATSDILSFYNNLFIIDTSLMPEEYKQPYIMFYSTNDSGYCMAGTEYAFSPNLTSIHYPVFNEAEGPFIEHKVDLGLVSYYFESPPGIIMDDTDLVYYHRSGVICGSYYFPPNVTAVNDVHISDAFTFLPNPASDELVVKASGSQPYSISLFNMMGQRVRSYTGVRQETTFSVSDLTPGVYNVSIYTESGENINHKVLIAH
jgi:hypothetical protein